MGALAVANGGAVLTRALRRIARALEALVFLQLAANSPAQLDAEPWLQRGCELAESIWGCHYDPELRRIRGF